MSTVIACSNCGTNLGGLLPLYDRCWAAITRDAGNAEAAAETATAQATSGGAARKPATGIAGADALAAEALFVALHIPNYCCRMNVLGRHRAR